MSTLRAPTETHEETTQADEKVSGSTKDGMKASLRRIEWALKRRSFWTDLRDQVVSVMEDSNAVPQTNMGLILDLNGALLFRETNKERVRGSSRPPDLRVHGKRVYFRDNLNVFLAYAFRRWGVGFWSSAMARNAKPLVAAILGPSRSAKFILTREHTMRDEAAGAKSHATIKDLSMIWEVSKEFNNTNTLIIDDTFSKVRNHPRNCAIVPEFSSNVIETQQTDDTLLWLMLYLEYCAHGAEQDFSIQVPISVCNFTHFLTRGRRTEAAIQCVQDLLTIDVDLEPQEVS